jgi:transketolase N-terminal domain/subunit
MTLHLRAGRTYLNGHGSKVKIGAIDMSAPELHQAIGWHNGMACGWRIDGRYTYEPCKLDLVHEATSEEPT